MSFRFEVSDKEMISLLYALEIAQHETAQYDAVKSERYKNLQDALEELAQYQCRHKIKESH